MATEIDKLNENYLTHFSKLVYSRQYEPAMLALMEILHAIEINGIDISVKSNHEGVGRAMSMIASGATALLSDPNFGLNRQGFSALMTLKGHLRAIFASSPFLNMSHIVANITNQTEAGMQIPALNKFLLVCSLDIAPDDILQIVSNLDEETRFLFWLSSFDNKYVLSAREEDFKRQMLDMVGGFTKVSANSIGEMQAVTRAWMHSSYLDFADKHKIKSALNVVIKNTMKKQGVVAPKLPVVRRIVERPKLLVVLEFWKYNNAMYRCFASAIENLATRFHLIAMIQGEATDERALKIFDEVISFTTETPIKKLVGQVIKLSPDIVFYPSLGMQQSAIQFAQFRLAPIQIMSVGHPASSFSDAMDYVVFEEDMLADPECFTEKILLAKTGAISALPPDTKAVEAVSNEAGEVIHIAVNSMYFKIGHRFLDVCRSISEKAERPIQYHFIIGLNPFNQSGVARWIQEHVPGSLCYDHLDYAEYSDKIAQCDIQLAPFPFGNTNSFVDAVRLGLPAVCMDGPEIHSHGDAVMARRVGLPDFCVAKNIDQYERAVLALVNDEQKRLDIKRELIESHAVDKLFTASDESAVSDFSALFEWIYQHHELVQSSGQKVWSVADRSEMG